jgi:CRISPR-associated protein Cmr6
MINTGLLFYKKYYDDSNGTFVYNWPKITEPEKKRLNDFFKKKLGELNDSVAEKFTEIAPLIGFPKHDNLVRFTLEVLYPGLIFGTGFRHETATPGEHKLGFTFDHITGLPSPPGSSIKGMLRSAFPQYGIKIKDVEPLFQAEKEDHILSVLGISPQQAAERALAYLQFHINDADPSMLIEKINNNPFYRFVHLLEMQVFEGQVPNRIENNQLVFKPLPMYERDVFLDAVPIMKPTIPVFADDAITHHPPNGFSEPNPVKFLKLGPGNLVHFQFLLYDCAAGLLDKGGKTNLFSSLLKELGMGAKTSTGYGVMKEVQYESKWLHQPLKEKEIAYLTKEAAEKYIPQSGAISKGHLLAAKIIERKADGKYTVSVCTAKDKFLSLSLSADATLEPGSYILVMAKGITKGELNSVIIAE